MNPTVDFHFTKEKKWKEEITILRNIALSTGLTEQLKWGSPCYTLDNNNIVLIHVFKEYCALLFFKGALVNDPVGILIKQSPNMQSARQIRFTNSNDIITTKTILKQYIEEAIEVEKAGLKVEFKEKMELVYSEEFKKKLEEFPELKSAFLSLTPGRQRAYNLHFSAPKQSKTRESRIEKCMPAIMNGKGLNEE